MGHWESNHRFGRPCRLKDAAQAGQIVGVRCALCQRRVNFLATDLVTILDPDQSAMDPPFPCSKCGKRDYINVTLQIPSGADYGHILVRRPAGIERRQKWATVKLGDEPPQIKGSGV